MYYINQSNLKILHSIVMKDGPEESWVWINTFLYSISVYSLGASTSLVLRSAKQTRKRSYSWEADGPVRELCKKTYCELEKQQFPWKLDPWEITVPFIVAISLRKMYWNQYDKNLLNFGNRYVFVIFYSLHLSVYLNYFITDHMLMLC